tara:strand:- start:133 stop:645 length:513 start_codon:yes stop_codon:yes gene_type:complete
MKVSLSPKEISICKQAATFRWQLARASGVVNQRRDQGRTDGDLDLLGIKAEMSVAKVFDIDHNPFQFGVDGGEDMWIGDISVDVKSTFYPRGRLLFKDVNSFKADCSVLVCQEDEENYNVVGYCSREKFKRDSNLMDLGHGLGSVMDQDDLSPLEKLWTYSTKLRLQKFN